MSELERRVREMRRNQIGWEQIRTDLAQHAEVAQLPALIERIQAEEVLARHAQLAPPGAGPGDLPPETPV